MSYIVTVRGYRIRIHATSYNQAVMIRQRMLAYTDSQLAAMQED